MCASNNFQYKVLSSMEKVLPGRTPSGDGARRKLSALKGETVSFQIGYFWSFARKGRGSVKASAPEGTMVRVRKVELVPCSYPCHLKRDGGYLVTEPALLPDLLTDIDDFGFPLVSGQWRSLWVDLEVSGDAPAGCFPVRVILEDRNGPSENGDDPSDGILADVSVQLEVLNAQLPPLAIPHTEWFHADCLADYYHVEVFSEEHWEIVENFVRTAVRRGCNMLLTPVFTPPLDTAVGGERRTVQLVDVTRCEDGTYRFGFDRFRRWVQMGLRCGIRYFEISHLFSQWGAVAAPKIEAWDWQQGKGENRKIFGWDTDASGPEYSGFLRAFLDAFLPVLSELEISDVCYFHISDEPSQDQLSSYLAAKEIVGEQLKDYHLIDALSSYEFYKTGAIKEPVCSLDHLEPFFKDRPEKLWTYYCTAQCVDVSNRFIALPGYRTRVLGMQLYKYQIDGFLHWGYNFYNSEYSLYPIDPYQCTDSDGAFPSGDPFLVYPGKGGIPQESMRLMLLDESFSDLRAMYLLEQLSDRETVLNCLEEECRGAFTITEYPHTAEAQQRIRDNTNLAIRNLTGVKG